jgi:hypothetical protein
MAYGWHSDFDYFLNWNDDDEDCESDCGRNNTVEYLEKVDYRCACGVKHLKGDVECELESERKVFICKCRRPVSRHKISELLSPEHILSEKRMRSMCAMCGKDDNLVNYVEDEKAPWFKSKLYVCKTGDCQRKYASYAGSAVYKNDLTHGIPYIWSTESKRDSYYRKMFCLAISENSSERSKCQYFLRSQKQKCFTCGWCGARNDRVVLHPRLPKHFHAASFCMNATCLRDYVQQSEVEDRERFGWRHVLDF